jgi:hypothetical protein
MRRYARVAFRLREVLNRGMREEDERLEGG